MIAEPFNWQNFDEYLPRKGKKELIHSLIELIDYVYIDSKIKDVKQQPKKLSDGFPNLRCMLDSREPDTKAKKYDLLFTCYHFNQTIYWVKDGDFKNGVFISHQPAEAIDAYMVHTFSQSTERFDFSPWAEALLEPNSNEPIIQVAPEPAPPKPVSFRLDDVELAAKLGNIPNQIKLGIDYSLGTNGFKKNKKRGHYWFWQAAKQGSMVGQYNWVSYWCKKPDYIDQEELTKEDLHFRADKGDLAATYIGGLFSTWY